VVVFLDRRNGRSFTVRPYTLPEKKSYRNQRISGGVSYRRRSVRDGKESSLPTANSSAL
jgi:hypothetical protein